MQRTVLLTGATSGLGRYLATELAATGARVLVHGRDQVKVDALAAELNSGGASARGFVADLTSLSEVRRLAAAVAEQEPALNTLVNNAGVGSGMAHQLTAEGHELHFAVNYLAPYVLTRALLPTLRANEPARIVNVGSLGQASLDFTDLDMANRYEGSTAYARSKLALAMFTFDLADELSDSSVTAVCLHPATYMDTTMVREAGITPLNTVEHGGAATMRVILDPTGTGVFYNEDKPAHAHRDAYDQQLRTRLHTTTEQLV
ncbi:MAG TPA: SDR family NAD(P)-dependent oxidoreductase [Pseudonocardiaceae bacterium]|jgi:NAD(P)-dependent dehydrogenase (short-subunit alcohol dehydrogenase family)|nr:SDR family NAD(P)-dependent oxidoreductase [Pseudonocardiaceae bacterium]